MISHADCILWNDVVRQQVKLEFKLGASVGNKQNADCILWNDVIRQQVKLEFKLGASAGNKQNGLCGNVKPF